MYAHRGGTMNDQPELKFRKTLEDIRLHFDFLFKRGYRIVSVLFADQNNESWQVSLMAHKCLIDIYGEKGVINSAVGTIQPNQESRLFDLEYLAQFINNGREFSYKPEDFPASESQQLQKIAGFLNKHFAAILTQVEKENLPPLPLSLKRSADRQKRTIT